MEKFIDYFFRKLLTMDILTSDLNTLVTLFASLIMLGALIISIKKWRITRKKDKRPLILNEVQSLILPFINILENNYRNLRGRNYGWRCYDRGLRNMEGVHPLRIESNKFTFNDFSKKHKKLGESIISYNEDISALEKRLKVIDKSLSTPKMREAYVNKAGPFNQKYYGQYTLVNGIHRKIIPLIIHNTRRLEPGETESFQKFWHENVDFFLKFREEESLKRDFDELDSISKGLADTSLLLNDELEKVLDKYRLDFDIPQEELTPHEAI